MQQAPLLQILALEGHGTLHLLLRKHFVPVGQHPDISGHALKFFGH
jgi:hypothetical protein